MRLCTTLCASLLLAACSDTVADLIDVVTPDAGTRDAATQGSGDDAGGGLDAGVRGDAAGPSADASRDGASDPAPLTGVAAGLFPAGFSVASPLAQQPFQRQFRVDPNNARSPAERTLQLAGLLSGKVLDDCAVMLSQLTMGPGDNVSCYGPQLDYTGHPDGAPNAGQLPGGDLGLWKATEASGEACAAAKLNALVSNIGRRVDFGLYAAASMVCTGRLKGLIGAASADDAGVDDAGAPAFLGKLDLKADLASVLAVDSALAVSEASLERVEDADGASYHYALELDVTPPMPGGGGPAPGKRTVRTELFHAVDPLESGTYHGRIWSTSTSGTSREAYSVSYTRSAITGRLRYHTVSANFDAGHVPTFDSAGHLEIGSDWSGNASQGIFDMSASDGTGRVSFAWQAGQGDSHARVFHAYTAAGTSAPSGCGFFSYGSRFDRAASRWPDNAFATFICNWAGPGNNHAGETGFAQKQCMAMDDTGKYVPTTSHIAYAPVNGCDSTGTSFTYKLPSEPSYTSTAIAEDLVKLADDTDYASFTPPAPLF